MRVHIDQVFNEMVRKIDNIKENMDVLKDGRLAISMTARDLAETRQEYVRVRILDRRLIVEEANAKVREWIDEKKAAFEVNLEEQKRDKHFLDLNERADNVEEYALAAFDLAIAAADEAAQAAFEALLARDDATRAALPSDHGTL